MNKKLGKLERVELREAWAKEDSHFTPWLAREENLELLADAIGMDLELESQEESVGRFRADILCKNPGDDSWVLIENQIERTNHVHLGQVLTYAAGLQAATIVWVASKFTDEHRAALDWLNEITDEKFHFFGLEIELWQIDDSPPAPKFNVVVQPNNWSKLVAQTAKRSSSQENLEYYHYWQQLLDHLQEKGSKIRFKKPSRIYWMGFNVGRKYCHIAALRYIKGNRIGVELYMWGPDRKSFFHQLQKDKIAIEREIGEKPDWKVGPPTKILLLKDADQADENDWPKQHAWFKEHIETFDRVFRERVRNLDPEQWNPDGEAV